MLRVCVVNYGVAWDWHLPLVEFAHNNSFQSNIQIAFYKPLSKRRCSSPICFFDVGERKLLGLKIVQETTNKKQLIREKMLTTQSHQKSYANHKHREFEFKVGNQVFLRVSSHKSIIRFGKKDKPSWRYIGPFKILGRVGTVTYRLTLSLDLASVHPVFFISVLQKYQLDPSYIIQHESLQLEDDLSYEELPIAILDRQVKKLHFKEVALVKVNWWDYLSEEVT